MKILVSTSLLATALFAFPMNGDAIPVLPEQFDIAHSGKAGFSIDEMQVHLASPDLTGRQLEFVRLNKLGSLPPRKEASAPYVVGVVKELGGTVDSAPGRSPSSIPEPSSLLFLSIGLAGVAAWRRKQAA